jgi:hypothetical protein
MPLQCNYLFLRLDAPQLDCLMDTAISQILTLRREYQDAFSVPLQSHYLLLRVKTPQFDCLIDTARSQILAVRREYHGIDAAAMAS